MKTPATQSSKQPLVTRARLRALPATLVFSALAVVSLAWQLGGARARAHELAQTAGSHMLQYAHAAQADAPRTLRVNGLALRMASGFTTDSVRAVLDFFHQRCRQAGNQFATPLAATPSKADAARDRAARRWAFEPIVRTDGDQNGYLGCLDFGVPRVTPQDLLERARVFGERGDLAALGDLRFVWAMREGSGTTYVAVASQGAVPIERLFPDRGDAPGADMPGVPRPKGSQRVLSAYQEHAAPSIVSYRVDLSPEVVRTQYLRRLIDGGFVVREREPEHGGINVLDARRGRTHTAIAIAASGGRASSVTLLPLE